MLAALPEAVDHVLARLQEHAAASADTRHLMLALPALARVSRYGDVRATPAEHLRPVLNGLFERVLVGLPAACAALDDTAADEIVQAIAQVQQALDLLDQAWMKDSWAGALHVLKERDGVHGLVRGHCCRLLLDQARLGAG